MDAEATIQTVWREEMTRETKAAPEGSRFARTLDDGTPRVSPSQINLVLDCGEKYRRRYILGDPDPTAAAPFFGTVFHAVMEDVLIEHKATGAPVDPKVAQAHGIAVAAALFNDEALLAKIKDPEALRFTPNLVGAQPQDEVGNLAGLAAAWLMREEVTPIGTEETVVQRLNVYGEDVAVLGRYDGYVEARGKRIMLDWKTAAKSPSLNEDGSGKVKRSHAHAGLTYADALMTATTPRPVDEVWIVYAVRTKTPKIVCARVPVTPPLVAWSKAVSAGAIRLIQLGALAPNPNGNLCSEKYCAYWSTCPGAALGLAGDN